MLVGVLHAATVWRIDTVNAQCTTRGDVWSFTTKKSGDPYDAKNEYYALDVSGKDADSYRGKVTIKSADKPKASFVVHDDVNKGDTVHIICEVTDDGTPPLTMYQRVIMEFIKK